MAIGCPGVFLMIRRPPRSTLDRSSAASDVYKRQMGSRARMAPEPPSPRDRFSADCSDYPVVSIPHPPLKTLITTGLLRFGDGLADRLGQSLEHSLHTLRSEPNPRQTGNRLRGHTVTVVQNEDPPVPFPGFG